MYLAKQSVIKKNVYALGLQQLIDKIDYYRLWKSSITILIID